VQSPKLWATSRLLGGPGRAPLSLSWAELQKQLSFGAFACWFGFTQGER